MVSNYIIQDVNTQGGGRVVCKKNLNNPGNYRADAAVVSHLWEWVITEESYDPR